MHPFTRKPLFDGGKVNCLSLNEIVSEKLRAAASRKIIAPRDFYDLDFILRHDFNLSNKEVIELFKKKNEEDGCDTDLSKYRINLGRSNDEIIDMRSRIEEELFDVLTLDEKKKFNLNSALDRINTAMKRVK
ncbi:MAG: nucleotidyl transferase AbiEii/AbiGii toxin family protein [Candidatus Firestonebacteria bacterium]|nr:nucleotidyl transferase AbiEii/AbiGii toxin family protein [Candidatus Firestonebacteria bacterium]